MTDFWRSLVAAAICITYRKLCWTVLPHFFRPYVKGESDEEKERYCEKAANHTYLLTYFIVTVCWGWNVLRGNPFLPASVGGPVDGSISNIVLDTMFVKYDEPQLDYLFWQQGFHLGNLIEILFMSERKDDFTEMFLHHVASNSLYFGGIYGNVFPFGVITGYFHDLSDLPLHFCRILMTLKYDIAIVGGVFLLPCWFWTRLCLLPQFIYTCLDTLRYP